MVEGGQVVKPFRKFRLKEEILPGEYALAAMFGILIGTEIIVLSYYGIGALLSVFYG